jgi:hypothetical protein
VLRFFYKRCIALDNQTFVNAIIEGITHIMFTANDGLVFNLIIGLYRFEHSKRIRVVQTNMKKYSQIKLA